VLLKLLRAQVLFSINCVRLEKALPALFDFLNTLSDGSCGPLSEIMVGLTIGVDEVVIIREEW